MLDAPVGRILLTDDLVLKAGKAPKPNVNPVSKVAGNYPGNPC
jgi:hypothetical protein